MGYQTKCDGKKLFSLSNLFLMDENKDVKYLLLGIDTLRNTIYRLIEIGLTRTRTTLPLSNFSTNVSLAANYFTFDASQYPEYYINQ